MASGKAGRRPWKAPDGGAAAPPWQTAQANAAPRSARKPKSAYHALFAQKEAYGKVKPGYGKTGRFK